MATVACFMASFDFLPPFFANFCRSFFRVFFVAAFSASFCFWMVRVAKVHRLNMVTAGLARAHRLNMVMGGNANVHQLNVVMQVADHHWLRRDVRGLPGSMGSTAAGFGFLRMCGSTSWFRLRMSIASGSSCFGFSAGAMFGLGTGTSIGMGSMGNGMRRTKSSSLLGDHATQGTYDLHAQRKQHTHVCHAHASMHVSGRGALLD